MVDTPSDSGCSHQWLGTTEGWTLRLMGDWRGAAALRLSGPPLGPQASRVTIDASGLSAWDGSLTASLREHLAPLARNGVTLDLSALPEAVRAVLELALPHAGAAAPQAPAPVRGVALFGLQVLATGRNAVVTLAFFGEVLMALGRLTVGRSAMRGTELMHQIDQTGPLSIPIVSLTCFLIGLMFAYMGGAQLDRIGAQSYIADLVTVGMVREVAGLMTGVILSGRVGASFAAHLATMKAGEEIDALRALGVDPIDHLVMPRVLALVLVAPLLIAYAALIGILAGMLTAYGVFGLAPTQFWHSSLNSLTWTHVWIGLFKGTLYAALVALAGCREGLNAGRNAQAVGEATTTGVVKSLVWIVIAAVGTTIVFQNLGL